MKRNLLIISIAILLPILSSAQNIEDALRYSSLRLEGTARSGAMGNAFGALGGDFTGVAINPAGLGIYRSSEFSLTPNFANIGVESLYLGKTMSDNDYKFGMNNASYVAAIGSKGNSNGLVSVNLGIGYNRLKDFNSYSLVKGSNAKSSFLDHITDNANRNVWSEYYEELAWQTDLLLLEESQDLYWNDIRKANYGQDQQKSYKRSGALDEYNLAVGLNFNHKFYVGASLGILDLYYKERTMLSEDDNEDAIDFFNYFDFGSSLRTFGTGYNFKLGVIFKPVNNVRLGASVASPTYFNLRDNFETSLSSSITYDDGSTEKYEKYSPFLEYDYDLVTPFRATLSGAYVIGKKGLVSADLEWVDYSISKFRNGGDGYDFITENEDMTETYKAVTNIRLGGEYFLSENFALRAGYELHPSAFNNEAFGETQPNAGENYQVMAGGFGYKSGGFFLDLAVRHATVSDHARLYPEPISTPPYPSPAFARFDQSTTRLLVTLGFKF